MKVGTEKVKPAIKRDKEKIYIYISKHFIRHHYNMMCIHFMKFFDFCL